MTGLEQDFVSITDTSAMSCEGFFVPIVTFCGRRYYLHVQLHRLGRCIWPGFLSFLRHALIIGSAPSSIMRLRRVFAFCRRAYPASNTVEGLVCAGFQDYICHRAPLFSTSDRSSLDHSNLTHQHNEKCSAERRVCLLKRGSSSAVTGKALARGMGRVPFSFLRSMHTFFKRPVTSK